MKNEKYDDVEALSKLGIGGTYRHWFGRGLLAGLMIAAAANGLSYFFRSDGVKNLIGASRSQQEAIGIPFEVWRRGQAYGTFLVDFPSFFANCGLGALFGIAVGLIVAGRFRALNRLTLTAVRRDGISNGPTPGFQFSIRSLLVIMSIAALLLSSIVNLSPSPKVLAAIFFAGPWAMVGLSMLPPRIQWQHRVVIMANLAVIVIGVAIYVGNRLNKPFDEILMGIFICWTPQSVLGIMTLVGYFVYANQNLNQRSFH